MAWLSKRELKRALTKEVGTLTYDSVVKAFSNGNWMCAYRALLWILEFQFIEQKFILYVEDSARDWSVKLKMRSGRSLEMEVREEWIKQLKYTKINAAMGHALVLQEPLERNF